MGDARMPRGMPRHTEKQPFWGRKQPPQQFWDHAVPVGTGAIQYIPSLKLMCVVQDVGNVQLRDPVTGEVVFDFLVTLTTDAALTAAYAPPANRLVVPMYSNSSGTTIAIFNLNTGECTLLSSLSAGVYAAVYCPSNDKVYVTAWQGNLVYIIDPWKDALHTTTSITGLSGITLGMCYSPVNDRLYAISRTANTAQKIDPSSNTVVANIATGGAFDIAFFSQNLKKVVLLSAASGLGSKTLDPLSSDTVATLHASGTTGFGGVSIPTTGETVIPTTNALRFYDQAGTNTTNLTNVIGKYAGWNPVTQTVWVTANSSRYLYIIDPVTKSNTAFGVFAVVRSV